MVRVIVSGISGRMGKRIASLALKSSEFELVSGIESKGHPDSGKDIGQVIGESKDIGKKVTDMLSGSERKGDVMIEFTAPAATIEHLAWCTEKGLAMVIGTTGIEPAGVEKIHKASNAIPIVFSPNMSVGANMLFKISEQVARLLGDDYKAEIVEAHHDKKKDAPSGTAKRLGEVIRNVKGAMPPIHSIRLGDIVGDHIAIFAGNGERIELVHRAHSRDAFAKGALDAARFLSEKKPGLYRMQDVIQSKRR